MLERWFEEIRRRTQVLRIFPNRASCIRLIGAHCMEAHEDWLGRRYWNMQREQIEREPAEIFGSLQREPELPLKLLWWRCEFAHNCGLD